METQTEHDDSKESSKGTPVDPSIMCLFSRKPCKRKRLRGFDFCHKHILEDKNSPFQQCSFIIKSTEERCTNPAPKAENKKTFCLIHTRDPKLKKAHDEIMRRNLKRKLANRKAALDKKNADNAGTSSSTHRSPTEPKRQREEEQGMALATESDGMYRLQDNGGSRSEAAWFDENDSDAESVDSEEEDPLRHAGVWTLEESLKICRDKMIRKRSIYLEQYKRLHLLLKDRRRKHLIRMAGLYQNDRSDVKEEANEDEFTPAEYRALGLYQHINGTEALLERQAREKRARGQGPKVVPQNRCHQATETQRCPNKVLPFTKFCLSHICCDSEQKLFKFCSFEPDAANSGCDSPVLQAFRATTCDIHAIPLPRFPSECLERIINPNKREHHVDDIDDDGNNISTDTSTIDDKTEGLTNDSTADVTDTTATQENQSMADVNEKPIGEKEAAENGIISAPNEAADSRVQTLGTVGSDLKGCSSTEDGKPHLVKGMEDNEQRLSGKGSSVEVTERKVIAEKDQEDAKNETSPKVGKKDSKSMVNPEVGQQDVNITVSSDEGQRDIKNNTRPEVGPAKIESKNCTDVANKNEVDSQNLLQKDIVEAKLPHEGSNDVAIPKGEKYGAKERITSPRSPPRYSPLSATDKSLVDSAGKCNPPPQVLEEKSPLVTHRTEAADIHQKEVESLQKDCPKTEGNKTDCKSNEETPSEANKLVERDEKEATID